MRKMPVDSESWEEPPEGAQLPEDDAEGLSRSARKREAQALRALIEKAAGLGREDFAALTLPEELREALEAARALRPRSDERRRQLQFAARRLRALDDFDLAQAMGRLHQSAHEDPVAQRLERLRARLLEEGLPLVNALCALIKDTDRTKLRQLVRQAQAGREGAATRLYRHLRDEFARTGLEVPANLQAISRSSVDQ